MSASGDEVKATFAALNRVYVACVRSPAVVQAFASVPREHFAGPGPWRILSPRRSEHYWSTEDADPRRLCHDVLVAIDETRRLNKWTVQPMGAAI